MDWMNKMNEAVAYIERGLDGEIDLAEAGRIAGCSAYHFQRVFGYMANTTLAEYIRRRRLSRAAVELQGSDAKVIDVAMKYGYDSPTAFSRAFAALHGMSPSEARSAAGSFTSYPPLSFQITIQGVHAMNYRIEQLESFKIVGAKLATTTENDRGYAEIPEFWARTAQSGAIPKLCTLMDRQPMGVLGVSQGDWNKTAFDYYIGVATNQPTPPEFEELVVPAATWAIFESVGPMPGAIQELQKRIVTEWLPSSGYGYAEAPDIEVYGEGDQSAADYRCQVWLPVVKKG